MIEIFSPKNRVEEIHEKIVEYFENEMRLVGGIYPAEKYALTDQALKLDGFVRSANNVFMPLTQL